tara:strand:- start:178 stop:432 length:255 start_codon:yes stop_codon:yes gene_type:complete
MYEPEVDDYVVWDRGEYGKDEGWVYFKGDPVDNELRIKSGWNPVARYITIETGVRPKPQCEYSNVILTNIFIHCYYVMIHVGIN